MMLLVLLLFALDAAPQPRACTAIAGDRILYSDLAAADSRFLAADPSLVASFPPAPGSIRTILPGEMAHLAAKAGVESVAPFGRACFERKMRKIESVEILAAIRKAWGLEDGEVEILEQNVFRVPEGELVFPKSASPANFVHGWIVFDKTQRYPVWAKLRLLKQYRQVVAMADIPAGGEIRAEQVRSGVANAAPDPLRMAVAPQQAIGRTARVAIKAGTPILLSNLNGLKQVERGAIVKVEVRDGGARLSFDAKAESDGAHGEMIALRNPASGKTFQARVTGENQVLVIPRGAKVVEIP